MRWTWRCPLRELNPHRHRCRLVLPGYAVVNAHAPVIAYAVSITDLCSLDPVLGRENARGCCWCLLVLWGSDILCLSRAFSGRWLRGRLCAAAGWADRVLLRHFGQTLLITRYVELGACNIILRAGNSGEQNGGLYSVRKLI